MTNVIPVCSGIQPRDLPRQAEGSRPRAKRVWGPEHGQKLRKTSEALQGPPSACMVMGVKSALLMSQLLHF